jgi:hypothetical protein
MDFTHKIIGNQIQNPTNWVLITTGITTLQPWP